jgi:hypothetical protein
VGRGLTLECTVSGFGFEDDTRLTAGTACWGMWVLRPRGLYDEATARRVCAQNAGSSHFTGEESKHKSRCGLLAQKLRCP